MKLARSTWPGETRICPHCKATILKSATACPACHRHLHFDAVRTAQPPSPTFCPLYVQGTVRHSGSEEAWEYSVLLQVHDDQGKEISRHVVGVGALHAGEARTFTVRVEIFAA